MRARGCVRWGSYFPLPICTNTARHLHTSQTPSARAIRPTDHEAVKGSTQEQVGHSQEGVGDCGDFSTDDNWTPHWHHWAE